MQEHPETGSVSQWLRQLDSDAHRSNAQIELWQRYFARLADLAQSRLPTNTRQVLDGEDAASSALASFYRRAEHGQFPDLNDRTGLWPLLAQITVFKALRNVRRQRAQKRGGINVISESELVGGLNGSQRSFDDVIADDPTPEHVVKMNEQADLLLNMLPDDQLRLIATQKLEGYRNAEIAKRHQVGVRTIERKLALIRSIWKDTSARQ